MSTQDTPGLITDDDFILLPAPDPFSFAETLTYLSRSEKENLYRIADGRVTRLVVAAGESVLMEVGEQDGTLCIRSPDKVKLSAPIATALMDYVQDWFDLNRPLTPFYTQVATCPLVGPLTARYHGLRVIGSPDLFEALCWAIIGQQINLSFAYTLKERFVEAFGSSRTWENRTYWSFPTPAAVARLSPDMLTRLQFSRKKAEYIIDVADRMATGSLSKTALLAYVSHEEARRDMMKIPGVGPWTAHYVSMRCLRDPAAFPSADVGLHNAVKALTGSERKPTPAELQMHATRWQGWEAYATFYLWRSLT